MTVSAPQRIAHTIFSTSSAAVDTTAELPMLALILTRKLRPIAIGSTSGWLMFAGMMARPRATSSRTNSGVMKGGIEAPKLSPSASFSSASASAASRARFSRWATKTISSVTMPARANSYCVTSWPAAPRRTARSAGQAGTSFSTEMLPLSSGFTGRGCDGGVARARRSTPRAPAARRRRGRSRHRPRCRGPTGRRRAPAARAGRRARSRARGRGCRAGRLGEA